MEAFVNTTKAEKFIILVCRHVLYTDIIGKGGTLDGKNISNAYKNEFQQFKGSPNE
jgi:hypothetical protein